MVINTNISALAGARQLTESSNLLSKSLARLSSGSRIVSPEDDAAGLAVSVKMDSEIGRIAAARTNVGNAISFQQTQDGFLQKVSKALNRMSELAISAQDSTKSDEDRGLYNAEFVKLAEYVNDLATKEFNGVSLFDGSALTVTTDGDGTTITTTGVDLTGTVYDNATSATIDSATNAHDALGVVETAIDQISSDRANVGANISVLNSYNDQLGVLSNSLSAANSRIKDVDVAEESANYARYNILVQAGTAMLAQANQMPVSVLKLLS